MSATAPPQPPELATSERKIHTAEVDEGSGRRDIPGTRKDDRPVKVSNRAAGPSPGKEVGDDGGSSADEPEPLKNTVDGAGAKLTSRSNHAPDNRSGVEGARAGTDIIILLVRRAKILDASCGPVQDSDLDNARPNTCNSLADECGAGLRVNELARLYVGYHSLDHAYWDLHVVAKFHV